MTCELQGPDCSGKVERRHDGKERCWMHWGDSSRRPGAIPMRVALDMAKEAAAKAAVRDEIHERNGIVLGIDPSGSPCSCVYCQNQPSWGE